MLGVAGRLTDLPDGPVDLLYATVGTVWSFCRVKQQRDPVALRDFRRERPNARTAQPDTVS
jgi:hypothetical protein